MTWGWGSSARGGRKPCRQSPCLKGQTGSTVDGSTRAQGGWSGTACLIPFLFLREFPSCPRHARKRVGSGRCGEGEREVSREPSALPGWGGTQLAQG